ncbi:MAG: hypothetical protein OEY98_02850 [Acidimicrobiia bacterium]|nr:hypothetical protein [Acidimicrobiia bacterium]
MKHRLVTSALVGLVMALAVPAGASSSDQALWVWDGPVDGVIEFAVNRSVTDLYLSAPPGFSSDARYAPFIADARTQGLRVWAVAGDASWAKNSSAWVDWTTEVVGFGQFDGIVADVEPYLLADWSNDRRRSRLISSYLKNLKSATAAAGSTEMLVAVPFWWDLDEYRIKGKTLVEQTLATTDGVVVMAYRDHAEGVDGIVDLAGFEVALGSQMSKRVVVGVETGAASLDKVTFQEEGLAAMAAELTKVEAAFTGASGYGGVAIHHYASYSTMNP